MVHCQLYLGLVMNLEKTITNSYVRMWVLFVPIVIPKTKSAEYDD